MDTQQDVIPAVSSNQYSDNSNFQQQHQLKINPANQLVSKTLEQNQLKIYSNSFFSKKMFFNRKFN